MAIANVYFETIDSFFSGYFRDGTFAECRYCQKKFETKDEMRQFLLSHKYESDYWNWRQFPFEHFKCLIMLYQF